ncbi:MAG: hypothetical protein ACOVOW_14805 [Spirosomataceae bacterium]
MYDIVFQKAYISLGLSALAGLAFFFHSFLEEKIFNRLGNRLSFGIMSLLFRFIPFFIIYVYYGIDAQSDVQIFWRSAQGAKELKLVYRDFDSLYSPFFAYITAIFLPFWDTARAVTLVMIVIELIALRLTIKCFPSTDNYSSSFKSLIYLLLPGPFVFCVIGGQEDIWMWGFACLVLYLWKLQKSDFVLGIATGLGLLATKAFFVLVIPPLFFKVNNKVSFVAGMAAIGLPVMGFLFYQDGLSFLMPLQLAQEPMSPNIWAVLYPFFGNIIAQFNIRLLNWIGLFLILGVTLFQTLRKKDLPLNRFLPFIWVVIFGIMMLFQIGSYANYVFIYAMPLLIALTNFNDKKAIITTFFINAVAVVQASLWFRTGKPFFHFSDFTKTAFILEYSLEIILLVGVVYWLKMAFKNNA